ncbi:MAG: ABC transporter permease [Gammaproteobacteria bacterium]
MTPMTRAMIRAATIIGVLLILWLTYPYVFNVKGVYFTTDVLIFVLLSGMILGVSYIRHKPHLQVPWREVFRRKLAVISLLVIAVYACIGVLDTIHFRTPLPDAGHTGQLHYSVDVLSVLDELLTPLRTHTEETYSAPFATHSYSKKMLLNAQGKPVRGYPRLQYGGAQLKNLADRGRDILLTSSWGVLFALLGYAVVVVALTAVLARQWREGFAVSWRRIWRAQTEVPWRVIYLTILVMLVIAVPIGMLSVHYHVFGTDKVGVDVFYESLKSVRTGLVIGTLTTLIMLPFAIMLGIMAGFYRGLVDDLIQYLYTTLNSIPGVLLIAAAILSVDVFVENHQAWFPTVYGRADIKLLMLCVVLGITSWTSLCRLLRGETLKLRELDYIQAATAFGVSNMKIITRHILPNVMHIVLIILVLDFSGLVLAESVLSYIGVGVDPSTYSWGNMINNARMELARDPVVWWSLLAAFIMMSILVLAANLFADAVRDAFDPRLKQVAQGAET